jgi:hypothetical protein
MHNPGPTHWSAVTHIFRYLAGTLDRGLCYAFSPSSLSPLFYTDSDHAGDSDTRISVSGGVALLAGGPVLWLCHKQKLITTSTAEAETVAVTDNMFELVWLRRLLSELGYPQATPTRMLVDNSAAISIVNGEASSRRKKHWDIRYLYNLQCIREKLAVVEKVPTDENLADIFTKSLPAERFHALREALTFSRPIAPRT